MILELKYFKHSVFTLSYSLPTFALSGCRKVWAGVEVTIAISTITSKSGKKVFSSSLGNKLCLYNDFILLIAHYQCLNVSVK